LDLRTSMQDEIQKVKLTEEREKGHSKGREVKNFELNTSPVSVVD